MHRLRTLIQIEILILDCVPNCQCLLFNRTCPNVAWDDRLPPYSFHKQYIFDSRIPITHFSARRVTEIMNKNIWSQDALTILSSIFLVVLQRLATAFDILSQVTGSVQPNYYTDYNGTWARGRSNVKAAISPLWDGDTGSRASCQHTLSEWRVTAPV